MTVRQRVKRIGGSLGVLLPRDIAKAMDIEEGAEVRLTLVGRQLVVEPADDTLDDGAFRRAFAAFAASLPGAVRVCVFLSILASLASARLMAPHHHQRPTVTAFVRI